MTRLYDSIRKYITLPLVAFLILAAANAYAIAAVKNSAKDQRNSLAVQTYRTQLAGCARTNDLRSTITSILTSVQVEAAAQAKKGEISPARAAATREFYDIQIKKVTPIDCAKVYPKPELG